MTRKSAAAARSRAAARAPGRHAHVAAGRGDRRSGGAGRARGGPRAAAWRTAAWRRSRRCSPSARSRRGSSFARAPTPAAGDAVATRRGAPLGAVLADARAAAARPRAGGRRRHRRGHAAAAAVAALRARGRRRSQRRAPGPLRAAGGRAGACPTCACAKARSTTPRSSRRSSARGGADLVVMARVLHHAARPQDLVTGAARLLRAGGHLAIVDHLPHDDEAPARARPRLARLRAREAARRSSRPRGWTWSRRAPRAAPRRPALQLMVGQQAPPWDSLIPHRVKRTKENIMDTRTEFPAFKVKDLSLAELGRKKIRMAEKEMPGLMALREEFGAQEAAQGRAHRRLPAHDDRDRGAHRDAGRARRRGHLDLVQHLLDAGRGRRRDRQGRRAGVRVEGRDAGRVLGRTSSCSSARSRAARART